MRKIGRKEEEKNNRGGRKLRWKRGNTNSTTSASLYLMEGEETM